MFNLFYPRIPQEPFAFSPQKYGNRPGLPCPFCKESIIHHASVSLCNCRIFTHKKCFLKQFPLKEQDSESNEIGIRHSGKSLLNAISFLRKSSSQYPGLNQQDKGTKKQTETVKQNADTIVDQYCIQIKAKQIEKDQFPSQQRQSKVRVVKTKNNFNPQFSKPICKNCDHQIQLQYQSLTILEPHTKPRKNLACMIFWAILLLVFIGMVIFCVIENANERAQIQTLQNTTNSQPKTQQDRNLRDQYKNRGTQQAQRHRSHYSSPLQIILCAYSAALSLILMIIFTITVLFKKKFTLSGVKVTQKSLQISAFEGIGNNMVFEDTNQQLYKKEVTL